MRQKPIPSKIEPGSTAAGPRNELTEDTEDVARFYLMASILASDKPEAQCALCDFKSKKRKALDLVKHVTGHLPSHVVPFECGICKKHFANNVRYYHVPKVHPEVDKTTVSGNKIRPEVADEAIELLLTCFPMTSDLRSMDSYDLKFFLSTVNSNAMSRIRHNQRIPVNRSFGGDPVLSLKYQELCSQVRGQLVERNSFAISTKCGKCNKSFAHNYSTAVSIRHAELHLSEFAYECPICFIPVPYIAVHMRKHRGENFQLSQDQKTLIRPEIAAEAIENLIDCFPDIEINTEAFDLFDLIKDAPSRSAGQLEAVTEENKEHLEKIAELFPLVLRILAQELRLDFLKGIPPTCSLCNHSFPDGDTTIRETRHHILGHLSEKIYTCHLCSKYYNRWPYHKAKASHDCKDDMEGEPTIRLEMVRTAFNYIFKCYPNYTHLLDNTPEQLKISLKHLQKNSRLNGIYKAKKDWFSEERNCENTAELQELGSKYIGVSSHILKEVSKSLSENGKVVGCGKCDQTFQKSHGGCMSAMRTHILSHLSGPPYSCSECGQLATRIILHAKREHANSQFADQVSYKYPIRPQMAEEAMENLFQCVPDFLFTEHALI